MSLLSISFALKRSVLVKPKTRTKRIIFPSSRCILQKYIHTEAKTRIKKSTSKSEDVWGVGVTEIEVTEDIISKMNKPTRKRTPKQPKVPPSTEINKPPVIPNESKEPETSQPIKASKLYKYLSEESWQKVLKGEFKTPYMQKIEQFLAEESKKTKVLPPPADLFRALNLCPFENVKVVIIGQDPYHAIGQANGLSFGVAPKVAIPPSLRNIYKELANDIKGFEIPNHGDLTAWAERGVLLLNACLTVSHGQANSHRSIGWKHFTHAIVKEINDKLDGVVFILWGRNAQEFSSFIDEKKHLVLKSAHPSPMAASKGFFGCKHFSMTNDYLISKKKAPIQWNLSPLNNV